MFRGSFEHTLDNKGRLSIPAKFREVLLGKGDDRIVITNFVVEQARCLDVYPFDEWVRFEDEVRKKPRFDRRIIAFQNYYLGKGDDRIVITNFVVEQARCLDVYPFDEWVRFEDEVRKKPRFDRRIIAFQNYY